MNKGPEDGWVDPRFEAEIIDARFLGTTDTGVSPTGIIVHRKPLTIVVSIADGLEAAAPLATVMVDELIGAGDLTFGPVAEALQAFVVAHQPTGVAALLDVAPDPIAFLFDQAVAIEPGTIHRGEGRSGWNTVFVGGDMVTLLAGAGNVEHVDALPGWSRLSAGTVAGAGARTKLTLLDMSQQAEPQPSESAPEPPAEENDPADQFVSLPSLQSTAEHDAMPTADGALAAVAASDSETPEHTDLTPTRESVEPRLARRGAGDLEVDEPVADVDLDLTTVVAEPLDGDPPDTETQVISLDDAPTTVFPEEFAHQHEPDPTSDQVQHLADHAPPVPVGALPPPPPATMLTPSAQAPDQTQGPAHDQIPVQNQAPTKEQFSIHDPAHIRDQVPPPPPSSLEPEPWSQPGQPPLPEVNLEPDEPSAAPPPMPPAESFEVPLGQPGPLNGQPGAGASLPRQDQVSLADLPPPPQSAVPSPPLPEEQPAVSSEEQPAGLAAVAEPISAPPPWPDVPPLPQNAQASPAEVEDLSKLPPPPADAEPSP